MSSEFYIDAESINNENPCLGWFGQVTSPYQDIYKQVSLQWTPMNPWKTHTDIGENI